MKYVLLLICCFTCSTSMAIDAPPPSHAIEILYPMHEETFHNDTLDLTVKLAVTPELEPGDKIMLFVDSEQYNEPVTSLDILLPWLPRGVHELQAKLVTASGEEFTSDPITFFQKRHSVLLGPGPFPKTEVNQMTVYRDY